MSAQLSNEKNKLYYGGNLEVLRRYIADESVDLIYLDPPFNLSTRVCLFIPAPGLPN